MEVHIRNMVCDRCVRSVKQIFHQACIPVKEIRLGVVTTVNDLTTQQIQHLKEALQAEGFEWMDNQKVKLVEQIRQNIIQLVQSGELDEMKDNLSAYLSSALLKDYHYLSQLFSSVEHTTIEQFFILQKIGKVKEWLAHDEYTVSEIAFKLGYSSVAHLSGQFKKVTGFTPSQFKQFKDDHTPSPDRISNL